MKTIWITITLATLCASGCGGSDESPCEEAGNRLCQMACDCGQDKCRLTNEGGSGATISFDDLTGCTDLYVKLGCMGGGEADVDFSACNDALGSAGCDADAAGGPALLLPASCQ